MRSKFAFAIAMLVAVVLLLTGCGSGGSKSGVEATIEAMSQPSPKLYLGEDTLSLSLPPSATTTIYGGSFKNDWIFNFNDEALKETFSYSISMASAGQTSVNVGIILKQGGQEMVLGNDSFVIDSDEYKPYRGQITVSNVTTESGDQLILRIEASGDDFGYRQGAASSIDVLENPETLPNEVIEGRIKALTWLATNSKTVFDSEAALFADFKDQLDYVILSGDNARWSVGWGLTKSEKPYFLDWIDGTFTAKEITIEEFQAQDTWSRDGIVFKINP
jgi:hypothetical protein